MNQVVEGPDGVILGHSAFIPAEYTFGESFLQAALSASSFVDPAYPGLFPVIYSGLETRMRDLGVDLLFAFPNENSFPFFVKMFRYSTHFFELMHLKADHLTRPGSDRRITSMQSGIRNALTSNFVQWRFGDSPLHAYEKLDVDGVGFRFKRYENEQMDILEIDLPSSGLGAEHFQGLLEAIPDVSQINIYVTSPELSEQLASYGFRAAESRNRLIFKWLGSQLEETKLQLQMLDSDVF